MTSLGDDDNDDDNDDDDDDVNDAVDDDTLQAVFKKQIDVFVEEGLDFVLCEVKLS